MSGVLKKHNPTPPEQDQRTKRQKGNNKMFNFLKKKKQQPKELTPDQEHEVVIKAKTHLEKAADLYENASWDKYIAQQKPKDRERYYARSLEEAAQAKEHAKQAAAELSKIN